MSQPECSVLRRHHEQMIGATGSAQTQSHRASTATATSSAQSVSGQSAPTATAPTERSSGLPWSKITIAVVFALLALVLIRECAG